MDDRAVECTFFAEGADVQLVNDRTCFRSTAPELVVPFEVGMVVEFRFAMHAIRQAQAARIRIRRWIVVKQVRIPVATPGIFNLEQPPAALIWTFHRQNLVAPFQ